MIMTKKSLNGLKRLKMFLIWILRHKFLVGDKLNFVFKNMILTKMSPNGLKRPEMFLFWIFETHKFLVSDKLQKI